jgi:hypothetical protein
MDERLDAKPDRPGLHLLVRAALWAALAVGFVGGLLALVRPPASAADGAEAAPVDRRIVPAPVAGVAELTVEQWLTATDAEREQLADRFVEPPVAAAVARTEAQDGRIPIGDVVTIGGRVLDDGYWSVTVVADLISGVPGGAPAEPDDGSAGRGVDGATGTQAGERDGGSTPEPAEPSSLFLEIGIVADDNGGFLPFAAPAIVPPPAPGEAAWQVAGDRAAAEADDVLARTIERFLGALLAGRGDAAPYLAPGADVERASRPPFTAITVVDLAVEELDERRSWVVVHALASLGGDTTLPVTYDLVVVERSDRWEIAELSGVPTLVE